MLDLPSRSLAAIPVQALSRPPWTEERYRDLVEMLPGAVYTTDAEGRIDLYNDAAARLWGRSPRIGEERWCGSHRVLSVEGQPMSPDSTPMALAVRQCEEIDNAEFLIERPDGARAHVIAHSRPIFDGTGRVAGAIHMLVDITARAALEVNRTQAAVERLRELDQRKNEFLATLAHELRNPLAPLRNGLEVLRIAHENKAMTEKARAMMERQLHQMVRLVDDLLDVSRVSRGKIELRRDNVELGAVLRNAMETSQPLMVERGHELVARIPDDKIVVYADMTRMSQVFWNLLNNAAKYTEVGGRIELSVEMREGAAAVTVRDNGIGIPPEMHARVFDIFTQVDRSLEKSQGGLGIGLSIARRLVEMHGGRIEVRSEGHGKGSAFTVTLPAAVVPATAEIPSGAAVQAGVTPMACKRILIADDNADSVTTLCMMLEMLGNEVRVAHDGEAAVRAAIDFRPDAILLDIGMPKLNGYDACKRLRASPETAGAYMVALTGWGQEEDRVRAKDAGFDHHMVKPVEPALLEKLIAEIPRRNA